MKKKDNKKLKKQKLKEILSFRNKKTSIFFSVLIIIVSLGVFSLAKYVLEVTNFFRFNLKGIAYNSDGLVTQSDISYTDTTNNLVNPERGFYKQLTYTLPSTYSESAKSTLLSTSATINTNATNANMTLILSLFYLDNYKTKDLDDEWLDALDEYCDSIREYGHKTIIRFAYYEDESSTDPSDFNQILSHMEQLEDFFTTNDDVIFAVQLGFIGRWGEWNTSSYSLNSLYRKQILNKALAVVPKSTQILVRRPYFYKEYFGTGYFDSKYGFTSADKARVGIYDDAYLANITDAGTYETTNRVTELKWMNYLTQYTLFGGESYIDPENEGYHEFTQAVADMKKTHITFLNSDYSTDVINIWKNTTLNSEQSVLYASESGYDYIKNTLGYRYVLSDSKLPGYDVDQGSYLHLSFDINNTGFNNLIYKRPVNIILEKDNKYYITTTNIDPRNWKNGTTVTSEVVLKIPGNIQTGEWSVYVQLPDSDANLRSHDNYFIKFANNNIYNSSTHSNYIGKVTIAEKSNNTDNGFYQVNTTDDESVEESELYDLGRYIIIDGKKTSAGEWLDADKVYDTSGNEIYLRADENHLYLYTKPGSDIDLSSMHILFSTIDSSSATSYNYGIENGTLYKYSTWFNSAITSVEYDKDKGFEYKIPLSGLNISSLDDLRSVYIEYIASDWSSQLKIGPIIFIEDATRKVDGLITYATEYTSEDIFEQTDDYTVYVKLVDDYFWIYAVNNNVTLSNTPNVRLYLGSKDKTLYTDSSGYMVFMDGGTVNLCTNSDCSKGSSSGYSGSRGINTGVEYKVPIAAINATGITDILKLRIRYMDSSWNVITNIGVTKTEKIYPKDIVGKTVVFAYKPSTWTGVRIHIYKRDGTSITKWPGDTMTEYVDGTNDKLAYILPDNSEYYVTFNDLASDSYKYPIYNQNIFRIESANRIWSGSTSDGMLGWTYVDSSEKPTYSTSTIFQMDGSLSNACVHLWGPSSDYTKWPGTALTKTNGTWEKTINLSDNAYSSYQILFTNCSGTKYHQNDSAKLIRGITVYGTSDSIWVTSD